MDVIRQEDLAEARKSIGLTVKRFGEVLGCSGAMVCLVENGKKRFGKTIHNRFKELFGHEIEWTVQPRWGRDHKNV